MIINRENDYFLISPILQKFRIRRFGGYFLSTVNKEDEAKATVAEEEISEEGITAEDVKKAG